jgi:hypothetical protein
VHYGWTNGKGALMPATLKLFKKAPQETWQADAATIPIAEGVVIETVALPGCASPCEAQRYQKGQAIVQDNSIETDQFVRSNN